MNFLHRPLALLLVLLAGAAAPAISAPAAQAQSTGTILFVTPGGTGECAGWDDACDLQYALAQAEEGDQVWVAAGVYRPTTDDTDLRAATFRVKDGVKVYGGFAGHEQSLDERDWKNNVTTLSGDIGEEGYTPDNVYHVVMIFEAGKETLLDGFTITGGYAGSTSGGDDNRRGGGIYIKDCMPKIRNVTLIGNTANEGGGMYASLCSAVLENVTFDSNLAIDGGGLYTDNTGLSLTDVTFSGNMASQHGAGIYNKSGAPSLKNVTFDDNDAGVHGGAIYIYFGGLYQTENVTINRNSARYGGGMYIVDAVFGLKNVTFSHNTADKSGGGIYNEERGAIIIQNSIFWGNTAETGPQIVNVNGSTAITNSVVQGGCPLAPIKCTNILTGNPLLGPLGNWGGATPTVPLLPGSSAFDAVHDDSCPAFDQRGVARHGAGCDIGAYESRGFEMVKISGDGLSALVNTPFAVPLRVRVSSPYGDPVDGGIVAFRAPASGASAIPLVSEAWLSGGEAYIFTGANAFPGSYQVIASAVGADSPAAFSLSNLEAAQTQVSLTSSPNPLAYGQAATFTAAVTSVAGTPTGSVQFKVDGENLGAPVALVNGAASINTAALTVGTHTVAAEYIGGAGYQASSSAALEQVVNRAATATVATSSANPSIYGQPVTFIAVVTSAAGAPGGVVQFKVDGNALGEPVALVNGIASYTTAGLSGGTHAVAAEYGGSASFAPSSAALDQVVNTADGSVSLAASANPAVWGQSVTLTAAVLGQNPGGAVSFLLDGAPVAGCQDLALDQGQAACAVTPGAVGPHTAEVEYSGDENYAPAGGSLTLVVTKAQTAAAVAASANPVLAGAPLTVTVTVSASPPGSGIPTGQVTLYEAAAPGSLALASGPALETQALVDGAATFTITSLPLGAHRLLAVYAGDERFTAGAPAVYDLEVSPRTCYLPIVAAGRQP